MNFSNKPRIKIYCISSIVEAKTAIRYGASALGLVGHMPSGPGVISDELIFEIARSVPPPVGTFLLTSETSAEKIVEHYKNVNLVRVDHSISFPAISKRSISPVLME